MTIPNLLTDIPKASPDEVFQDILRRANIRIERIVSRGQRSPEAFWYDQAWDEWVLVLRGRAGLQIAGQPEPVELGPGDHLLITAGTRHRVAWTDATDTTIWLAVHIHSPENL
jgi:cupin 2 domain-containing protein